MVLQLVKMGDDEISQESNPWRNLSTVTTFDRGHNLCTTRPLGEIRNSRQIVGNPSFFIGSLLSQICAILERDPSRRKQLYFALCDSAYRLNFIDATYNNGELECVRNSYNEKVINLIHIARSTIGADNSLKVPRPLSYTSNYENNFTEIGFIAEGGFGSVYKAVHKLDEVTYAIKKIIVRPEKVHEIVKYSDEVKTFAQLNHTNIVAYKNAWIESMSVIPSLPSTSQKSFSYSNYDTSRSGQKSRVYSKRRRKNGRSSIKMICSRSKDLNIKSEESDFTISFIKDSTDNKANDNSSSNDEIQKSPNKNKDSSRSTAEESTSDESKLESKSLKREENQIMHYRPQKKRKFTVLYIQMALCERTLREWLDERNANKDPTPTSMIATIATQILCGLNYIHSKEITHHDIKPSNIFVSNYGKLQIQLGDFGLACPLRRDGHKEVIGTQLYAAPEQLNGECNPKSDIYSLGIVLLELLVPMQTTMELIQMKEDFKKGKIPQRIVNEHPEWVNILKKLIQYNPDKRPSSNQLLEDLKIDKDLTITKLQNENDRLINENNLLLTENRKKDDLIHEKDELISKLKSQLAKFQFGQDIS